MKYAAFIPKNIFELTRLDANERFPYRWRAKNFPALRFESPSEDPWDRPWHIELRKTDGKNRERTARYLSALSLRCIEPIEKTLPTPYFVEYVLDVGKYCNTGCTAKMPYPIYFYAAFPGPNNHGWLMLNLRKYIEQEQPQAQINKVLKAEIKQATKSSSNLGAINSATVNAGRSNENRQQEAIALITTAVAVLKEKHVWDQLSSRQKIKLLQDEVRSLRGTSMSSQTLYQGWIRPIWE